MSSVSKEITIQCGLCFDKGTYVFEHAENGAKPHNPVGDIKEVVL